MQLEEAKKVEFNKNQQELDITMVDINRLKKEVHESKIEKKVLVGQLIKI